MKNKVPSYDIPIIGDSKDVPQDDPQFTLNFYAEEVKEDIFTLKPTPGTELDSQLRVNGGGRGIVSVAGRLFGVRGSFFQEKVSGNWVNRGTLATSQNKVSIIYNLPPNGEGQILIVDDTNGYVFELVDNAFTALTEAEHGFVGGASQSAYCAARAYVFVPGTGQMRCSSIDNFLEWPGLAFASAESLSTPLRALASNGDLLYVFSDDGFEVWQNQGPGNFALTQILAGDNIGILASNSILFVERYVYWLGRTSTGEGVVYRHQGGGSPERITTHAQERVIASLETPSDALGWSYNSLGHVFYGLNFQQGNKTLVWDKTTNLWHNRATREPVHNYIAGLTWVDVIIHEGEILTILSQDGKVLHVDDEIFTDQGNPIPRERILSVVPKEGDWLSFYQSAELFAQYGNTPVNEEDPKIMMRASKDRGMTWGPERWKQSGGNNTYAGRTRWVGLGAAYGLVLWFKVLASQFVSWRQVRMYAE